jgi:hypothetical protein
MSTTQLGSIEYVLFDMDGLLSWSLLTPIQDRLTDDLRSVGLISDMFIVE